MHLVAWLPRGMRGERVARIAAVRGLRILPITRSQIAPESIRSDGLLLGFASDTPDELREGVRMLADILRDASR